MAKAIEAFVGTEFVAGRGEGHAFHLGIFVRKAFPKSSPSGEPLKSVSRWFGLVCHD